MELPENIQSLICRASRVAEPGQRSRSPEDIPMVVVAPMVEPCEQREYDTGLRSRSIPPTPLFSYLTRSGLLPRFRSLASGETVSDILLQMGVHEERASLPDEDCPVCLTTAADTSTPCGHWFCSPCLHACLQRALRCPVCKRPVERASIFTLRSEQAVPLGEYVEFLFEYLASREGKSIVITAWGRGNEKCCAEARKRGIQLLCFRGNARQKSNALRNFDDSDKCALMIEPKELPFQWGSLTNVVDIIFLLPLAPNEALCCVLRRARASGANEARVSLVVRRDRDLPEITAALDACARCSRSPDT